MKGGVVEIHNAASRHTIHGLKPVVAATLCLALAGCATQGTQPNPFVEAFDRFLDGLVSTIQSRIDSIRHSRTAKPGSMIQGSRNLLARMEFFSIG